MQIRQRLLSDTARSCNATGKLEITAKVWATIMQSVKTQRSSTNDCFKTVLLQIQCWLCIFFMLKALRLQTARSHPKERLETRYLLRQEHAQALVESVTMSTCASAASARHFDLISSLYSVQERNAFKATILNDIASRFSMHCWMKTILYYYYLFLMACTSFFSILQ